MLESIVEFCTNSQDNTHLLGHLPAAMYSHELDMVALFVSEAILHF